MNRATELALRKRFFVTFDFELQAAATWKALYCRWGKHSFPLDTVFAFLNPGDPARGVDAKPSCRPPCL